MIARIWYGYTTKENADKYEKFLLNVGFPSIAKKNIKGYHGIQLLRKEMEEETEFATIMWFDNIEDVKAYAGENYEIAAVLPEIKAVLKRFDAKSNHLNIQYSSARLG